MAGVSNMCKSDSLQRMKNIFYEHGADAKITFKDAALKVNKGLLSIHSAFFNEVFFGKSPVTEYFVADFDSTTFKLFLDCLMGFKPYTDLDSLLIFPIAHKYGAEESLQKCVEVLCPKVMNETVCHTLNLALFYEHKELIDNVIAFLNKHCNAFALLESDEYCSHVLEPIAIAKLLENVDINFYVVEIVSKWAENYLKRSKSNKAVNIGSFLREHKILDKLLEISFESVKSTLDFCKFNEENNIFTSKQLASILQNNISDDYPRKLPKDSVWVTVKKGEVLEEFYIKSFQFIDTSNLELSTKSFHINVWRNEIAFMDCLNEEPVLCQITFDFYYSDGICSAFKISKNNSFSFDLLDKNHSLTLMKNSFSFEESKIINQGKKALYKINLDLGSNFTIFSNFKITYTFNSNCRILKTSVDSDPNKLLHTFDITAEVSEKLRNNSASSENELDNMFHVKTGLGSKGRVKTKDKERGKKVNVGLRQSGSKRQDYVTPQQFSSSKSCPKEWKECYDYDDEDFNSF